MIRGPGRRVREVVAGVARAAGLPLAAVQVLAPGARGGGPGHGVA